MKIKLRKMISEEYDVFYEYSINSHVSELMKESEITFEEAFSQTETEVREMLPLGMDTNDNYLMTIVNISDNRNIGFIWYLIEVIDDVHQCFLCDFVIAELERRKGYAIEALNAMERNAEELGCKESVLFVAKENEPAQKLYDKCGYTFLREIDEGLYLKKELQKEP